MLQPDLGAEGSDPSLLIRELEELKAEQQRGTWGPKDDRLEWFKANLPEGFQPSEDGLSKFDFWVSSRIKRGIELTAILRRTNTGPARPKGRSKKAVDVEAVRNFLLDD